MEIGYGGNSKMLTFFFFFSKYKFSLNPKILAGKSLTELPISWDYVPWSRGASVTACDPEGQWLTNENCVWLPVLTPVAAHAHPTSLCAFNAHAHDISCTRDVGDQNQVEVTEAVDCESDPSVLAAWHPA